MTQPGTERRRWPRVPAALLGDLSAVIVSGPEAKLVDLSRGGALLEVPSRLPLRSAIRVRLTSAGREPIVAAGRVGREKVASIVNGRLQFRVAIVFEQPIAEFATVAKADNVTPFPTPGAQTAADTAAADEPPALEPSAAKEPPRPNDPELPRVGQSPQPPIADAQPPRAPEADDRVKELTRKLEAATSDLACQAAIVESMAARLKKSEELRTALQHRCDVERGALEAQRAAFETERAAFEKERAAFEEERAALEEERSIFAQQVDDAVARADSLQAALHSRDRQHAEALSQEQGKYEAIIAQLVKATNELEAELETAHSLCNGHEERHRALRREVEKLMWLFTSPVKPAAAAELGADIEAAQAAS